MLKVGDVLPNVVLTEYNETEGACAIGPNDIHISEITSGKTIAIFGVPGAFTPTCSAQHVPRFLEKFEVFKQLGVDEVWCISVNDSFVMGAWARDQKTQGKIRMLADSNASFAKATGLELDLTSIGLGLRSTRYSMLVKDGKVTILNNEASGKLTISDADTLISQIKDL
jgi:peroxiredoxin